MSSKERFHQSFDETKFLEGQREAAAALVEYEFTPKKHRKTKQQIADELGVCRKTLHNWEFYDSNFIAYKNYLASEFTDSHLPYVYRKLLDAIERGSVTGIDLFLKRIGDLDQKAEITVNNNGPELSAEERKKALEARLKDEE